MKIKINKISLFILVLFLCVSAVPAKDISLKSKLDKVNRVEVLFFKGKKGKVYKSNRKIDLIFLKDLILKAKNNTSLKCDSTCEITYFINQVQVFKAYFCNKSTGSKYGSSVTFQTNNHKTTSFVNYGSEMLIEEVFYQFQK